MLNPRTPSRIILLPLLLLYGLCVFLLQNIAPELVPDLLAISLVIIGLVALWKLWTLREWLWYALRLPIHFYQSGIPVKPSDNPSPISVLISAVLCAGVLLTLLLIFALPILALIIAIPIIGMAFFAWQSNVDLLIVPRGFINNLKTVPALTTAGLPRLRLWLFALEMGVIVVTTLLTTTPFYRSPPTWQLSGNEVEWLTSTAAAARIGLQEYGRIPHWQPYLAGGEPLIENPFNFLFNPFASGPSLLIGPVAGLRLSVILGYFMAGLGGWFLGRVLGLGALGRVLLAMLMIGKGNLHAAMNAGYYQLALSQVYIPYIIGGVIALFRWPKRRWPVVWTGLALALQFLSGNIWYVLPTAVGAICVGAVLMLGTGQRWIDLAALKRLILSAVIAVGLSAIVALPVTLQFRQLGRHPDEVDAGWFVSLPRVVQLYFDPNPLQLMILRQPASNQESWVSVKEKSEFYYSFVIPDWYVLIIFLFPLYRPVSGRERRIWWVALILFALATLWGAGGKQPILWLYQNIPELAQWRFVGRALAVGSFWLAVAVVMRLDNLWRNLVSADWAALLKFPARSTPIIRVGLGAGLIGLTLYAGIEVNDQWYKMNNIVKQSDIYADHCMTWLRQTHPDEPLSVWQQRYNEITTFLNNRVRTWQVGADFVMLPQTPTIGSPSLDLNAVKPRFAQIYFGDEVSWPYEFGYHILRSSPPTSEVNHCLFERDDVLPYAYSVTRASIETMTKVDRNYVTLVDLSAFSSVRLFERRGDQIALIVTDKRAEPTIVGVQETAYPGWRVEVDGKPAHIESVGGQIGVVLPAGDQPVEVYFVYDPALPVIGGIITLITAFSCMIFLVTESRRIGR